MESVSYFICPNQEPFANVRDLLGIDFLIRFEKEELASIFLAMQNNGHPNKINAYGPILESCARLLVGLVSPSRRNIRNRGY